MELAFYSGSTWHGVKWRNSSKGSGIINEFRVRILALCYFFFIAFWIILLDADYKYNTETRSRDFLVSKAAFMWLSQCWYSNKWNAYESGIQLPARLHTSLDYH